VPKDKLAQVSGMNSFSNNLVSVISPILATSLYAIGGLEVVLIIDLVSFLFAFLILLFVIEIPENTHQDMEKKPLFSGCYDGFCYLSGNKGIFMIIITMALLNFFSRLTYENILTPMILSRSSGNSAVLGIVNAVMGVGGIVGGIIVSFGKRKRNAVKMIYLSAIFSFLCGDVMMGVGRNVIAWSFAGLAANLPIAFINAGQMEILYKHIPEKNTRKSFFSQKCYSV
jgi:hypothetical protein